jgi:hypothetical protein
MASGTEVSVPYGLKPINLVGGQVFAGSTRMYPIQYGYATDIFNGDFVKVVRGSVTRAAIGATTASNAVTGVFLGCSYTDPVTKQKRFSQYWPASTLAGDCVAYINDDPDTVYKAAVCSSGVVMASGAYALVGTNLSAIDNASGNVNTGNSLNAILAPVDTPVSTILPLRCVGLVEETSFSFVATGSSSGATLTLTGSGSPQAIPVGTSVSYYASNGELIQTGSFVDTAAAAGDTSITLNAAIAAPGSVTAIPASSTVVFTVYRELLVKLNVLTHGYYSSVTA